MIALSTERLEVPGMPVYWRIRGPGMGPHPTIPATLPLALRMDPALGLLLQDVDGRLRSALREIYLAESNIGYLQEGHTLARGYGQDLLGFLGRSIDASGVKSALEIGCGGCLMLSALAERGIAVKGVDPSPVAAEAGRKRGVEVVPSFFPPEVPTAPVDLIFHSDVLEHVEDPVAFLQSHHGFLTGRGRVAIAVPDSTESVATGDISMLMHQHLNYFTTGSLRRVVGAAGFDVVGIEKSGYGGSLYCLAQRRAGGRAAPEPPGTEAPDYFRRAAAAIGRIGERLARAGDAGFYMPLRSAPYLSGLDLIGPGLRVFDDTAHWHRGQIDGLPVAIENLADFGADPPREAFVMSLTFGNLVREKIRGVAPRTPVTTLHELLAP